MEIVRWKIKDGELIYEMWFSNVLGKKMQKRRTGGFLVFCYGCPSHPFDHNPAGVLDFIKEGYTLVYPRYIGTWESGGRCNFKNAVDSLLLLIKSMKKERGMDIITRKQVQWLYKPPQLIGASFGGSVALVAAAKIEDVKSVVALAPIIDFRVHNKGHHKEEDLNATWRSIEKGWKNLWRVKKADWSKLKKGQLDINPVDYVPILKNKNTVLVHGFNDQAVHYTHSIHFHNLLKKGDGKHDIKLLKSRGHLGTYNLGERVLHDTVMNFL